MRTKFASAMLFLAVSFASVHASADLIPYQNEQNKMGFVNENNQIVIEAAWNRVAYFRDGKTAIVTLIESDGSERQGIIDTDGHYLVPCEYLIIDGEGGALFGGKKNDGFYLIFNEDRSLMGFYDIKNHLFCEPMYSDVVLYQDDDSHMIAVRDVDEELYGYINAITGEAITEFLFDEAGPVTDGVAAATAYDPDTDEFFEYIVHQDGRMIMLAEGITVEDPESHHGLFIAADEEGFFLINTEGIIVSDQYDSIELSPNGINYLGLLDDEWEIISLKQ